METARRPGGLTALAAFNFLFAFLALLSSIAITAMLPLLARFSQDSDMNAQERADIQTMSEAGTSLPILFVVAGSIVTGLLLIVSGIGYLKLRKFLGRALGNVYAIVSIIITAATAVWIPTALGGGFNIATLLGFLYPVLTLLLLNTTFKDDFVN
jgi:hypothetical protein